MVRGISINMVSDMGLGWVDRSIYLLLYPKRSISTKFTVSNRHCQRLQWAWLPFLLRFASLSLPLLPAPCLLHLHLLYELRITPLLLIFILGWNHIIRCQHIPLALGTDLTVWDRTPQDRRGSYFHIFHIAHIAFSF